MPAIAATPLMLKNAREAYHALVTGTLARVIVDQNGERVEFTAANRQVLYSYISELSLQLGQPCGAAVDMRAYHPAGFVF